MCSKCDGEVIKQGHQKRVTPVVAILQRKLSHVSHSKVFYTTQKGGKIFTMTTVGLAAVIGWSRVQETCRFIWQKASTCIITLYKLKLYYLN